MQEDQTTRRRELLKTGLPGAVSAGDNFPEVRQAVRSG
jgi:hypothetical protein